MTANRESPAGALALVAGALAFALCMAAPPAAAQAGPKPLSQYVYEHWDADDGLPQNSVNAIAQTPDGFLWLGTFEGPTRFDGSRMDLPAPELIRETGRAISRMAMAPDDSLWMTSFDRGVSRLDGHELQHWGVDEGLPSATATVVAIDPDGHAWVGTSEGVVRIVDGRVQPVPGTPARAIRDIAFDRQGRAWVALRIGGVLRLEGDRVEPVDLDGLDTEGLLSNSLMAHPDGGMWVGTSRGLFLVEEDAVRPFGREQGLAGELINKLAYTRDGALWIGFDGEGLQRMDARGLEAFGPAEGLVSGFVQSLHEDDFGSLWIGSNAGVSRLRDGMVSNYGRPEGMPGEFARTLAEDSAGAVWVGLDDGGAARITDGEVEAIGPAQGLAGATVRALAGGADGSMWIASYGQALQRFRGSTVDTWRIADGLPSDLIRLLLPEPDGSVLIGSEGGGLVHFDGERFTVQPGTGGMDVRAALRRRDGSLWLGTYSDGLLVATEDGVHRPGDDATFPWTRVMALYEDRNGHLWVGLQEGMARHDGERTIELAEAGDMFARAVFFISEDSDGSLWFSGNTGIAQLPYPSLDTIDGLHDSGQLEQLERRRVDSVDGLRSQQINGTSQPAGLRASDGRLWFPTARGPAVLDPRQMLAPEPEPRVFLEEVVVQGRLISLDDEPVRLAFPPGTERIEFRLSAVHGLMPNSPLLQTRLVGFDDEWGTPNLRRDVLYAALAPGEYRFEARAMSPRGTQGPRQASLAFSIQPTLAQRAWFWPGMVVLALLLATGVMMLRARRLDRRALGLERRIAERTAELQQNNRALQAALLQVEQLSRTDALTGTYNRRFLEASIASDARAAEAAYPAQAALPARKRRGLVVLVVDIDFFKEVNDRHGHAMGDQVLTAFATMLRKSVRGDDLVVRWGGEEFIVLMRGASLEDGIALAERITASARQTTVQADGLRIQRNCSVGLACHPFLPAAPSAVPWSDTVDVADQAMYLAKSRGRDDWVALLAPETATDPGLARRLVSDPRAMLAQGEAVMEAGKPG